ncbi:hypothetical protein B0H19DRAFT_1080775 [Mycena capillaripes]|nr:hypothetical protein B0H19DRAFT_1080775 [Mycena capillaripes]
MPLVLAWLALLICIVQVAIARILLSNTSSQPSQAQFPSDGSISLIASVMGELSDESETSDEGITQGFLGCGLGSPDGVGLSTFSLVSPPVVLYLLCVSKEFNKGAHLYHNQFQPIGLMTGGCTSQNQLSGTAPAHCIPSGTAAKAGRPSDSGSSHEKVPQVPFNGGHYYSVVKVALKSTPADLRESIIINDGDDLRAFASFWHFFNGKNIYFAHVTVSSKATEGSVTVTRRGLGNATNPSVTVTVASVQVSTMSLQGKNKQETGQQVTKQVKYEKEAVETACEPNGGTGTARSVSEGGSEGEGVRTASFAGGHCFCTSGYLRSAWEGVVSTMRLDCKQGADHGKNETGGEGRTFLNGPALALPHCPEHQRTQATRIRDCEIYKFGSRIGQHDITSMMSYARWAVNIWEGSVNSVVAKCTPKILKPECEEGDQAWRGVPSREDEELRDSVPLRSCCFGDADSRRLGEDLLSDSLGDRLASERGEPAKLGSVGENLSFFYMGWPSSLDRKETGSTSSSLNQILSATAGAQEIRRICRWPKDERSEETECANHRIVPTAALGLSPIPASYLFHDRSAENEKVWRTKETKRRQAQRTSTTVTLAALPRSYAILTGRHRRSTLKAHTF